MKLYDANAPTAMNAALPSETWPVYPVRILSPRAVSERMSTGSGIAENMYGVANSGTKTKAMARMIAIRSVLQNGKDASAAYVGLNWLLRDRTSEDGLG
jgi:hypothetical protein